MCNVYVKSVYESSALLEILCQAAVLITLLSTVLKMLEEQAPHWQKLQQPVERTVLYQVITR